MHLFSCSPGEYQRNFKPKLLRKMGSGKIFLQILDELKRQFTLLLTEDNYFLKQVKMLVKELAWLLLLLKIEGINYISSYFLDTLKEKREEKFNRKLCMRYMHFRIWEIFVHFRRKIEIGDHFFSSFLSRSEKIVWRNFLETLYIF